MFGFSQLIDLLITTDWHICFILAKNLPFRDSGNNDSHFHFRFKKAEGKSNGMKLFKHLLLDNGQLWKYDHENNLLKTSLCQKTFNTIHVIPVTVQKILRVAVPRCTITRAYCEINSACKHMTKPGTALLTHTFTGLMGDCIPHMDRNSVDCFLAQIKPSECLRPMRVGTYVYMRMIWCPSS